MIDEFRTIIRTIFPLFATASMTYMTKIGGFASQMKKDIPICCFFYFFFFFCGGFFLLLCFYKHSPSNGPSSMSFKQLLTVPLSSRRERSILSIVVMYLTLHIASHYSTVVFTVKLSYRIPSHLFQK